MYNNTIARARKDSQGQRRNCRMSAASQAPHIPRAMRIAERDAEYRQHQSPNRGSQTAQPASSDWHESKNMREGPPSSKESKSPRCNGQHSGCRRRRPMLPYMLPLRQPSLLLLLGWPPVRLVLEGLNKKIAARASNLAARIVEQTENKIPGTNIEAWTEIVLRETKDALKHGSLDDIDGDAALREEIAALKAENTRLTAALARGSAPAKQQVWCHTCYKMGTHETKDHDDNRANNGNGGKGGKGNDGKGGKGNDGKGGKGATDQTYYDKNGVVIWRSKADQAAHMAQKQQQRKP